MGKDYKGALVKEQLSFCFLLMKKLHKSTSLWATAGCPDLAFLSLGLKEEGASKTQIKQDIIRMRRELNKLSRLVDD